MSRSKYITEILDEINKNPKAITEHKDNFLLKVILAHAFLPNYKFDLPEGEPPFKPDPAPLGMSETNLYVECKKFHKLFVAPGLKPLKREAIFIGLLEHVHPTEANLIIAVKDQKLGKLYPKITWKLASDAGIIPAAPEKEKKAAK